MILDWSPEGQHRSQAEIKVSAGLCFFLKPVSLCLSLCLFLLSSKTATWHLSDHPSILTLPCCRQEGPSAFKGSWGKVGPTGYSRLISPSHGQLISNLNTSANFSPPPCTLTQPKIPGIRLWAFWGVILKGIPLLCLLQLLLFYNNEIILPLAHWDLS